ncbi:hypothetical protein JTB14_033643 [Gonioctena quinquepunctata]|nr:hypothetical protein JTB14_033643 [Gonioctena quinquepunctata]
MKYFIVASFCLAVVVSLPLGIYEDNSGGEYYVVPLDRIKRDTTYDIQGPDLKGVVKHEGTILTGDNYQLDGSAYAAKDLTDLKGLHKPELLGGDFKLKHDNGLSAVLGADHLRGGPTDVKAGLNYDIYHDKNVNIDLDANYRRQFGGPFGAGKPDAGVFLTATGRF